MFKVEYDRMWSSSSSRVLYHVCYYVQTVTALWMDFNAYCADPACANWSGDYPDEAEDRLTADRAEALEAVERFLRM